MTATPQIASMPVVAPNNPEWAQIKTEKPSPWKRFIAFFHRKKKDPVPAPMPAPTAAGAPPSQ